MILRLAETGLPAVCCLCPSVERYPWYLGTRNKKNIDTGHHDQPVSNHKWKSILVGIRISISHLQNPILHEMWFLI